MAPVFKHGKGAVFYFSTIGSTSLNSAGGSGGSDGVGGSTSTIGSFSVTGSMSVNSAGGSGGVTGSGGAGGSDGSTGSLNQRPMVLVETPTSLATFLRAP